MALANGRYLLRYKVLMTNKSVMNISDENDEPIVLKDLETRQVYMPGTTLAGAFRSYVKDNIDIDDKKLFGDKNLSKFFIYDSYADFEKYETRPSVKIDEHTGANKEKSKFDRYYVGAGHNFNLKFEVYADSEEDKENYKKVVYELLSALDSGDIMIGSYKSIGAGAMEIKEIAEEDIDLKDKKQLFSYLKGQEKYKKIEKSTLKKANAENIVTFELKGNLKTPILIKGNDSLDYKRPDGENITNADEKYFIPGSSIKGVVRNEARKVLKSLNKIELEKAIFGSSDDNDDKKLASKIRFFDAFIEKDLKAIYNRIKIDKFTGGVRKSAILNDEPLTGDIKLIAKYYCNYEEKDEKEKQCKEKEINTAIGLISVIFKNIAIGEVAFGSGNSIGRGRVDGKRLVIKKGNKTLYDFDFEKEKEIVNNLSLYISALKEA
ncbi:MAG: RAMP superfamily CRISPR-associated protein [Clostridium sp.]